MKRMALAAMAALVLLGCGSDVDKNKGNGPTPNASANAQPGSSELTVGALSGDLVEGNPPVTFQLSLTRAPTGPVTVTATSAAAEIVLDPAQVTFDSSNFQAQQRVSVSVIDNSEVTGDRTAEIDFSLSSEDVTFNARPVNPLVVQIIEDDATPSYDVVSADGFEVAEDGTSIVLDITLSVQPDGDVLVPIRVDDPDEAEVDVTQLTFAPLTWNLPQQVTVTGLDDLEADGDTTFNLVLGPSNSTGTIYNGAPETLVSIVNIDGVCGNGVVDGPEACEPQPNQSTQCAYGEMSCTYCTAACEAQPGTVTGYCGDGTVQSANEDCDEPTRPCPYGQMSCRACRNCQDVAGTVSGYCGDGNVQTAQGEQCDPGSNPCCDSNCMPSTSECIPDCLIISEYYEGPGMDKAVEIHNCGTETESLTGITLCLYQNADTSCTRFYEFSGTIAPGAVTTVCNSNISDPNAATRCDAMEGNVTQFNGDDRLALFMDFDGDHVYDPANEVMLDAFGQLANRPLDTIWADEVFQRCDFGLYLGTSPFNVDTFYKRVCNGFCPFDPMSDFGVAPVEGCF